jgi:NADH-quinone oxidoreductase subunit A
VALVFIIFDALAIFLFPWVLVVRDLGRWGILSMFTFLAIISLGWVYAYRERILEWK